ncbi:MAG: efflux RND transporter periplasmic adaptor subunit [Deltaproteobacteria bacterium]|nr:efflux RND transporter periplasmic adaptor subunit [Deltaproteobacteria bacterium]
MDDGGRDRSTGLSPWQWVGLAVLGLILLGVSAYTVFHLLHSAPREARRAGLPLPVKLERVQVRELVEMVGATTVTAPFQEVNLRPEVPGVVKEVLVKLGDQVAPDTLVIRLDDRKYLAELRQAQAAVRAAVEQVGVARKNYDRYRTLHQKQLIPLAELERYRLALAQAQSVQASAQRDAVVARKNLEATRIPARVHGVVSQTPIHPGEFVDPNTRLMSLGQITPIFALAKVPEEKIKVVSLHQEAQVTFDAFPGQRFAGRVFKIDPRTDPETRVFGAYVELANADQALKLGLTGYTRLEHRVQALAVPSIAVIELFTKPMVFVVQDRTAVSRPLVVGGAAGGYTWIKEGLMEGEEVVVGGHRFLREGDRVKVGRE